jgi:Na+/H+ antiporter NhaD/arsenite permease-like protein
MFSIALIISDFRLVDVLNTEKFNHVVDIDILGLLTGMIIILTFLNNLFLNFSIKIIKIGGRNFYLRISLLMIIVALTSAFYDNVVTILVMGLMIILIADILKLALFLNDANYYNG